MMDGFLGSCQAWLDGFVARHRRSAPEEQRNIDLKALHSRKVLAAAQGITPEAVQGHADAERLGRLACVAALLHDAGRFPQYARYQTFRDDVSVNHGWLGSRVLRQEDVLAPLPRADALLVLGTVHLHNRRAIPAAVSPELRLLLRVVRDADKIDILRVFREEHLRVLGGNQTVVLGLVNDPARYTPELLTSGGLPDYRALRYCNDYIILLLSWAFDLNFASSRRLMLASGVVDEFQALLPADAAVAAFGERVRAHLAS